MVLLLGLDKLVGIRESERKERACRTVAAAEDMEAGINRAVRGRKGRDLKDRKTWRGCKNEKRL